MHGRLYLDFCGEECTVEPGGRLTFGRAGDLAIDDNPYMHRLVGVFEDTGGTWCLGNLGRGDLAVRDLHAPSTLQLAPGAVTGLMLGEFAITFVAGPTTYELLGALERHEWDTDLLGPAGLEGLATLDWGRVELNDDQHLLLVALCEHHLRDPTRSDHEVPPSRLAAARLGWSLPKFNRKLDHLAEKLARAGLRGVHGELGSSAVDRRRLIIDHALTNNLVSAHDLVRLEVPAA